MAKRNAVESKAKRTVTHNGQEYSVEGMPRDIQDLYDDLLKGEQEMKECDNRLRVSAEQLQAVRGKVKYIGDTIMKRIKEMDVQPKAPALPPAKADKKKKA